MSVTLLKFSINNWNHLYSLEQAILNDELATGKQLSIEGTIRNELLLGKHDTPVHVTFNQVDGTPEYSRAENNLMILGKIKRQDKIIESTISVNTKVFEELRKNLMEYADIDGIHIVVSIGLISSDELWPINTEYSLVKLDYAMKGDA
jgi:hypothetical protein